MCKQSLEPKAFIIQNSYHAQPWCGLQAYPEFVAVLATTDPVLCSSLQQCETAPSPVLYTEKNTFIGARMTTAIVRRRKEHVQAKSVLGQWLSYRLHHGRHRHRRRCHLQGHSIRIFGRSVLNACASLSVGATNILVVAPSFVFCTCTFIIDIVFLT